MYPNLKLIVDDLNSRLYDDFDIKPIEDGFIYSYWTDGTIEVIEFVGIPIFNSENDSILDEETDEYFSTERLCNFMKSKAQNIGQQIVKYSK